MKQSPHIKAKLEPDKCKEIEDDEDTTIRVIVFGDREKRSAAGLPTGQRDVKRAQRKAERLEAKALEALRAAQERGR